MILQGRNLAFDMQGEDVKLLHSELQSLSYEISQDEITQSFFGQTTHDAVRDFQRKRGLTPNGVVDERTAQIINAAVDSQRPIPEQFIVSGQVFHQDKTPLEGLIVRAFDIALRGEAQSEIQLGQDAITKDSGVYEITYLAEVLSQREKRRANLLVRVFSPEGASLAESAVRPNAADLEILNLFVEPQIEPSTEEELQSHKVVFRLLNQETEEPLSGYSVRVFDLDVSEEPLELGFDISNSRGLFSVVYTTSPEEPEARRRLRLHVINSAEEEIHQIEVQVASDQTEIVDVSIPIPVIPEPPSPALEQLNETLQLELPRELLIRLEEEKILTVDDIRKAGGISAFENLPVVTDHPAVRTLEAHANLSVLSADTVLNEALIKNGFDSIATIANTSKDDFIDAMPEQIDKIKAIEIHIKASNQDLFLSNVGTMLRADQASGLKSSLGIDPSKLSAYRCECDDCESAVSPLAYLADLLKYIVKNLRVKPGNKITLNGLALQLHQPFDKLPASCEEMDNKVRQVRLCIEVLRRYLKLNNYPAAGSDAEKKLQKTEQEYLIDAYEALLTQLGTSYEEIRLARNADSKKRKALASKLGIDLKTARPDQLDQLLLNTDLLALTDKLEKLTENNLEVLFGLVSTDISKTPRNPLSDGPSLGDNKDPQITRWNLKGVELYRNTDVDGFIHVKLTSLAAGGVKVELYRDPAKTLLVASGKRSTHTGTVKVRSEKFSGLYGQIEIAYVTDSDKIQLSAIPTVLSWRLAQLRSGWKSKDWPSKEADDVRPLIDPDLIGLGDLRTELANNPAYDLWKERSTNVTRFFDNLKKTALDTKKTPQQRFEVIFIDAVGKSTSIFTELRKSDKHGTSIKSELKKYHLTYAGFKYLVRLLDIVQQANPQILDSEWDEVCHLLVEVKKQRFYFDKKAGEYWRKEEKEKNIVLGPDFFKLRDTALTTYPPPKTTALPAWRATRTNRLDWEDELESRIDQEDSLIDTFEDVADKVEVSTLEELRDALILATITKNDDLQTQAKWVTDYLLIDAKADACQQTTRISQAIETLQVLLWSLRIGQLVKYTDLYFTKDAKKYFDLEWKWIGSYTTWRAAMLVFLYPENILIPTLRKKQTPAFKLLVKSLRKNRSLTPEQACQEGKNYSDYFRDICNLKVEASCHALTHLYEGECRDRKGLGKRTLFYTFARGSNTKAVYWSAYDYAKDNTDYPQSFWALVPELDNVTNIIGAHPYISSDKEGHIYLFATLTDEGEQKLIFIRYDLKTQSWEKETVELELPEDTVRFDAVLVQRLDNWIPRLVIRDRDSGTVYTRRLSADGSDWEDDGFLELIVPLDDYSTNSWHYLSYLSRTVDAILAAHQVNDRQIVLILDGKDRTLITLCFEYSKYHWFHYTKSGKGEWEENKWAWFVQGNKGYLSRGSWPRLDTSKKNVNKWIGSFEWNNSDEIYAFWRRGTNSYYQRIKVSKKGSSLLGKQESYAARLELIVRDSGPLPSKKNRNVAYHFQNASGGFRKSFTRDKNYRLDHAPTAMRIAPHVMAPFDLVENLSQSELQKRRQQIDSAWISNKVGPQFNLTYLEEAYYFVPMQLALQLQKQKHYLAALDWFRNAYDYTIPEESKDDNRKIYYGLTQEETLTQIFKRDTDWMRDPLNPHLIASTRLNTYTRFTLLSIIRCLLAYADAEFTRDTTESLARARTLYRTALELLDTKALKQDKTACEKKIDELIINIEDSVPDLMKASWINVKITIQQINNFETVKTLVGEIRNVLASNDNWDSRFNQVQNLVNAAISQQDSVKNFAEVQSTDDVILKSNHQRLLSDDTMFQGVRKSGASESRADEAAPMDSNDIAAPATDAVYNTRPSFHFCISPNPVLKALRLKTQLNLHKLRTCRNIAGMKRAISPYSSATDQISGLPQIGTNGNIVLPGTVTIQPTLYRYSVLISRAKELVNIAQQMEAAMLSAIEKTDAEAYNRLKARQDMQLARSQVKLQTLRVKEAKDGVKLADLQKKRAQIQVDQYQEWLTDGLTHMEEASLGLMITVAAGYTAAALAAATEQLGLKQSAAIGYSAQAVQTTASMLTQWASYERRAKEWEFQKSLAGQDVLIGSQQIKISQDHVRVVGQEHTIAKLQKQQAKDTMEFLTKKFTNAELYDWMSDILEEVYAYFLQEATAVAKLAENQLAFERQSTPANYIQDDYWKAPSEDMVSTTSISGKTTDRRGLTGSARLLEDLYQLDQYAFETDKRKLQLTKTISLAALSPIEFQHFRETGVLAFKTTMGMFDRDFPGHYLRLIKRLRTSVIALIPPTQGIHATLSTTGLSRAVISGTVFQKVNVKRNLELVALSSPREATGLFELNQQSEMLLPFEGLGVDTSWEFRLPKPANQFDYSTITDVLIAIDYTALNSTNYQKQVVQTLGTKLSADRPFSFRHTFADAWYDLHNPDQTKNPMVVTFKTRKEDFPPNLNSHKIQHFVLYFSKANGETNTLKIPVQLTYTATDSKVAVPAPPVEIETIKGVISTRRGHASGWMPIVGLSPFGEWTLTLKDNQTIRDLFEKEEIEDILFVITYTGHTPAWPK